MLHSHQMFFYNICSQLSDRIGFRLFEAMGAATIFLQSDRIVRSKLFGVNEALYLSCSESDGSFLLFFLEMQS